MAFCPELMRNMETKSLAEEVLKFGSFLVEANVLCDAHFKKSVTQYLAFKKKLLESWGPSGSLSHMNDLGEMWLGLDGWTKAPEVMRIFDSLLCLVIRTPYSFDFKEEAFRVFDYNEGLKALRCSRSLFSLEGHAALASVSTAPVHESMLMR